MILVVIPGMGEARCNVKRDGDKAAWPTESLEFELCHMRPPLSTCRGTVDASILAFIPILVMVKDSWVSRQESHIRPRQQMDLWPYSNEQR